MNNNLEQQLKRVAKEKINASYKLSEIFTKDFMRKHTKETKIEDFFEKGGFDIALAQNSLGTNELDQYVAKNSDFSKWHDMLHEACVLRTKKNF